MRFLILRSENLVAIDNAEITIDCSSLAANIEMVVWQEVQGKLEFNDRPSVRTTFTDPSPYQPLINAWMTAFAAQTPPLQLAQAKQIKSDYVDAIYQSKRRLPFTHGSWQYDGADEAVISMTASISNAAVSNDPTTGLVAAINAAFSTLTGQINTAFSNEATGINARIAGPINASLLPGINAIVTGINSTLVPGINAMVDQNNSSAGSVNAWSGLMAQDWASLLLTETTVFGVTGGASPGSYSYYRYTLTWPYHTTGSGGFLSMAYVASGVSGVASGVSNIAIQSIAGVTVTWGTGSLGDIPWQPLNASALVNIPVSEFSDALDGIVDRRNSLNTNRASKKTAINALATMSAVIAYDATTGWSF